MPRDCARRSLLAPAPAALSPLSRRYHSTHKALRVMDQEGKLPAGKTFRPESLGEYWADHCDYTKYLAPEPAFIEVRQLRHHFGPFLTLFSAPSHLARAV